MNFSISLAFWMISPAPCSTHVMSSYVGDPTATMAKGEGVKICIKSHFDFDLTQKIQSQFLSKQLELLGIDLAMGYDLRFAL